MQLLAAWLAGLVLVDGAFLTAASYLSTPTWAPGLLVVAAILNVPIFLGALFLLQTLFRPQMLEDSYYSQYLERKYSASSEPAKPLDIGVYSKELAEHIIKELGPSLAERREPIERVIRDSQLEELVRRTQNSRGLSELYLRPELWPRVVQKWAASNRLIEDLQNLKTGGLIMVNIDAPAEAELTELGRTVATIAEKRGYLWSQNNKRFWKKEGQSLSRSTS